MQSLRRWEHRFYKRRRKWILRLDSLWRHIRFAGWGCFFVNVVDDEIRSRIACSQWWRLSRLWTCLQWEKRILWNNSPELLRIRLTDADQYSSIGLCRECWFCKFRRLQVQIKNICFTFGNEMKLCFIKHFAIPFFLFLNFICIIFRAFCTTFWFLNPHSDHRCYCCTFNRSNM